MGFEKINNNREAEIQGDIDTKKDLSLLEESIGISKEEALFSREKRSYGEICKNIDENAKEQLRNIVENDINPYLSKLDNLSLA